MASWKFVVAQRERFDDLESAFHEAVVCLAANKKKVNGWFAEMSKVKLDVIDRASRENKNYSMEAHLGKRIEQLGAALLYGAVTPALCCAQ